MTVAPIEPEDTEALVARLALDCEFDAGSVALRPPNGSVSTLDCEPVSFDQSRVPDPCFDPSVACRAAAAGVCSTCKTKCAAGDTACVSACARETPTCRTRCLTARTRGHDRCGKAYTKCSERDEKRWRRNCSGACDTFRKCSSTCEDPWGPECGAKRKKLPNGCWDRCML